MICESCAETAQLKATEREFLRFELGDAVDGHTYMHGRGCAHCNGTGYRGRLGVYEMLEVTEKVADAANAADPADFIRVAREQMAGETLRRHAVRLVVAGKTTVGEAMRISNQFED
jgi:MSHA biogenesis protein MshE